MKNIRIAFFFILLNISAFGQVQNSRFADNFDLLKKDTLKINTPLPELKSMAIASDCKLSIGGEIREQFQYYANENWAANGNLNNNKVSVLQRYALHANFTLGKHFRIYSEIFSAFEDGRKTPNRIIDENKLDLHQVFFDFYTKLNENNDLIIRIGRQEMAYAQGKLFHYRDATNTRQAYEGIKTEWKNKHFQIDAFYMNPLLYKTNVFDDKANYDNHFYGIWAKIPLKNIFSSNLEPYLLNSYKKNAVFYNQSGKQNRYTFGLRWHKTDAQPFNFDIDAAVQTGTIGDNSIFAYNLQGEISYKLAIPWNPTLRLATEFVSGDRSSTNQLETFDVLYPLNYYGLVLPIVPTNIKDIVFGINAQPMPKLDLKAQVFYIMRNSNSDGLYSPPMGLAHTNKSITGSLSDKDYVCTMYWLQGTYNFRKYIQLGLTYNYVTNGNYIENTQMDSKETHFINTFVRLRF
ncbi:alginate export family protein [Flavobacterium sp.]|uniref:alginate export family protein n=1 Tax=Flavobacterium sp. TaxID=239 RepID=UPI0026198A23|nr:alginate export family protein [Flavobacterium sp.]